MKTDSNIFDNNVVEYDEWYEKHSVVYHSELRAIGQAIPPNSKGIEIGAGTGRFSAPFSISIGVEPSARMAELAQQRGMTVINAVAEYLPFHNESFDFALMVTTVCFLSDIPKAFSEVYRILKPKGNIILAIIDKNSDLGKKYEQSKSSNKFYRDAHFHSTEEIVALLKSAGFERFAFWQTLTTTDPIKVEEPQEGLGKGSFVVIKALKV